MEVLVFSTDLGHSAMARQGNRLHALTFGHPRELPAIHALEKTLQNGAVNGAKAIAFADVAYYAQGEDELVDRLTALMAGEATDLSDVKIDTSHLTDFGRKVIAGCRQIPWGETRTYGQLAAQAGREGAARAVGSVMARNRIPLVVPCHRVLPAAGGLGGFSAPQGVLMKKRLLKMEQAEELVLAR